MKDSKHCNSEFLWFIGPSASGKGYAIRQVCEKEDHILRTRLILLKKVKASILSLGSRDANFTPERFVRHLIELQEGDASILTKWQWPDTQDWQIPQRLKRMMPGANHRVVALYTTPSELVRRCKTERTELSRLTEDNHRSHLKNAFREVVKLKESNFPVISVDSSDREYNILTWEEVETKLGQVEPLMGNS